MECCSGVYNQSPIYEVTVQAISDKITPPDLSVVFKVKGVKADITTFTLKREAENVMECICGVFYCKKGINFWQAIIAFFPKKQLNVSLSGCTSIHNIIAIISN